MTPGFPWATFHPQVRRRPTLSTGPAPRGAGDAILGNAGRMSELIILPERPFTLDDLDDVGLTEWRLRASIHGGIVRRVVRGVYAAAHLADTIELRIESVALIVDPGHVIVDRTAAWLHGIDVLLFSEHEVLPPVETCVLRGRHPTERADVDGRTRDLAKRDIMTVGGVRVTTPLRTALDLGCNLRRRDAFAALVDFARRHGITPDKLARELGRFKRRRGVVQLRELIPLVDARIESPREAWLFLAILDAGLPPPTPQFWIDIDGVPTYRLDFAYPRSRVCVEYDGVDAHEKSAEQRRHDEERRAWLRAHGWTVIVVRLGDFTGEALESWLRELREALRPAYTNRRW